MMALTDAEARDAYEFLAASLQEHNLTWVLGQVEERIAVGKTTVKKISPREFPGLVLPDVWTAGEARERRPSAATSIASDDYSDIDRLELLVTALTLATTTLHDCADQALAALEERGRFKSILFAPEVPTFETHQISSEQLVQRKEGAIRLRTLLAELMSEIQSADQTHTPR